jgi:hypothetical protein
MNRKAVFTLARLRDNAGDNDSQSLFALATLGSVTYRNDPICVVLPKVAKVSTVKRRCRQRFC